MEVYMAIDMREIQEMITALRSDLVKLRDDMDDKYDELDTRWEDLVYKFYSQADALLDEDKRAELVLSSAAEPE
jgi:hypothetical protein